MWYIKPHPQPHHTLLTTAVAVLARRHPGHSQMEVLLSQNEAGRRREKRDPKKKKRS